MSLSPDNLPKADAQAVCLARFDANMREALRPLVTDALIAEHRARPNGPHTDALSRVLNYLRRAPVAGKYALYAEKPFAAYRIVVLTGRRGDPPRFADGIVHPSESEAAHAVFLRRIAELYPDR
jgi:branched-chain amino acid transport system permease protein